jgi:GTP cyclohydrolase I
VHDDPHRPIALPLSGPPRPPEVREQRLERLTALVRELIAAIGENPGREGLIQTPARAARAWFDITNGYEVDLDQIVNGAIFDAADSEMVLLRDIEVLSLCEHHLLPFFGRCHVAYLPRHKVLGLSKVARIVEACSRRLQIQERLTTEIATAIDRLIEPSGVGVIVEARHMCMIMRGVEKPQSIAVTSSLLGRFKENPATRAEFLSLVSHDARP